jgi:hypothetical protein
VENSWRPSLDHAPDNRLPRTNDALSSYSFGDVWVGVEDRFEFIDVFDLIDEKRPGIVLPRPGSDDLPSRRQAFEVVPVSWPHRKPAFAVFGKDPSSAK